ncbi:MAG: 1-phosphofructokinase family hexose kinase [Planctomycetaceae bacterium]
MIAAIGLTPAWQQVLQFETIQPGEVNRAVHSAACASGKVLNVAKACFRLGAATHCVCPVGGPAGDAIVAEFAGLSIATHWVRTAAPTRTCVTLLEESLDRTTELVENSRPLSPAELRSCLSQGRETLRQASVAVLSGSLPPETPPEFYARLLEDFGGTTIVDARGPELLAALACRPFLVKPNREELSRTLGRAIEDETSLRDGIRELNHRGAEWVLVTDGPRPAWLSSQEEQWRIDPIAVANVVNPIGCGDSVAAGIAVGIAEGLDVADAVSLGLAAGAANASRLLPIDFDRDEVDRLRAAIES